MKNFICFLAIICILFSNSGCIACKKWESYPEPEDDFPPIPSDWSISREFLQETDTQENKTGKND